eukprot:2218843-Pleurochrysis_carterae.AAC.1
MRARASALAHHLAQVEVDELLLLFLRLEFQLVAQLLHFFLQVRGREQTQAAASDAWHASADAMQAAGDVSAHRREEPFYAPPIHFSTRT